MPKKPRRPCGAPRCPELVDTGRYCETHQKAAYKRDNQARKDKGERGFYGADWRRLRKMVLNAEPLCRHCQAEGIVTPANEVDHIDGDSTNLSWDNLQPLCKHHHSRKTALEQGAFGRPKK